MPPKRIITVKLADYLQSIGVTKYTLGKWVDGVSPQTVYAVASHQRRPSLDVLAAIISALHAHGFDATLDDLLCIETEA